MYSGKSRLQDITASLCKQVLITLHLGYSTEETAAGLRLRIKSMWQASRKRKVQLARAWNAVEMRDYKVGSDADWEAHVARHNWCSKCNKASYNRFAAVFVNGHAKAKNRSRIGWTCLHGTLSRNAQARLTAQITKSVHLWHGGDSSSSSSTSSSTSPSFTPELSDRQIALQLQDTENILFARQTLRHIICHRTAQNAEIGTETVTITCRETAIIFVSLCCVSRRIEAPTHLTETLLLLLLFFLLSVVLL